MYRKVSDKVLQADLQTGAARQGKDSNQEDAEAASSATDAEDVSERWDDKKRQDAVETLLASCAGNNFICTATPPKVCSYRESDCKSNMPCMFHHSRTNTL